MVERDNSIEFPIVSKRTQMLNPRSLLRVIGLVLAVAATCAFAELKEEIGRAHV